MPIYSTVDCAEVHGSRSENYSMDSGLEASVQLRCAWADRYDLIQDILLGHAVWPNAGIAACKAISAGSVPEGGIYITDGQSCEYETALVTVNYSTKIHDLLSESIEPTVQFQTLDYKRFRWTAANGDPLLEGEAPGKQKRGLNLCRTLYEINPPLPTALLNQTGNINTTAYVSSILGLTFPARTLLYHPPQLNRTFKSDGNKAFTIQLKFTFEKNEWNKFWRAKTETYEEIFDVTAGAAYENYPEGDFSDFLY